MNSTKQESERKDSEIPGTTLAEKDGVVLSCITVIGQIEGHYLLSENQKSEDFAFNAYAPAQMRGAM